MVEHLRDGARDRRGSASAAAATTARRSTTPLSAGVAGPHARGVQRRVPLHRRRVEVELPPLAVAAPRAVEADARDGERAVGARCRGSTARWRARTSSTPPRMRMPVGLPGFAAKKSPLTPTTVEVARGVLLHVGQRLRRDDRVVRERRRERVERAVRPRRDDDVEHDRAVRRELDLALVRDARHEQRLRRSTCGAPRRAARRARRARRR